MDKKLAITAITLVAVTMGIAAISPAVFAQEPPRDPACNQIDNVLLLLDSLGKRGNIPNNALEHIGEASIQIESVQRIVCEGPR